MQREGKRLILEGAVTLDTAAALLAESGPHLQAGVTEIDFGKVTGTDSAAVALALEWARLAAANKAELRFVNLPDSMQNMARLYAVTELLSIPAA